MVIFLKMIMYKVIKLSFSLLDPFVNRKEVKGHPEIIQRIM